MCGEQQAGGWADARGGLQVVRTTCGLGTQWAERMESQAWAVDLSRGCRTVGSARPSLSRGPQEWSGGIRDHGHPLPLL